MTNWEYLTTPLPPHNQTAILNDWGKKAGSSWPSKPTPWAVWWPSSSARWWA